MSCIDAYIPPPVLITDNIGTEFNFDTPVLDLRAVHHKGCLPSGSTGNRLIIERVLGQTVIEVECKIDPVEESKVDTSIKSIGIFPG